MTKFHQNFDETNDISSNRTITAERFFDSSKLSIETPTLPPKKMRQTFVLHTQNSTSFVLRTQKRPPKKSRTKKDGKKAHKKNFLKHVPELVLLLSWNRSKTGLVNHSNFVLSKDSKLCNYELLPNPNWSSFFSNFSRRPF